MKKETVKSKKVSEIISPILEQTSETLRISSLVETGFGVVGASSVVEGIQKSVLSMRQEMDNSIKTTIGMFRDYRDMWIESYNKEYSWFIFHGIGFEEYRGLAKHKNVDDAFLEWYTMNSNEILIDSIDTLKTSEWGEEIAHIIDFANEDIEKNYVAILPFLYMMIERKIRAYKNYKFNMYTLAETIEEIEDDITSNITLGLQDESSNIILESIKATKSDKFGGFKRHVKEGEREFNRNSVMHGSISPKYWDFMDFVKLVNATTFMLLWMPAYTGYDELE